MMILTGETEELGESMSQCHFVYHKSHMDWPGREPGLRGERPATNRLSHGTAKKALEGCLFYDILVSHGDRCVWCVVPYSLIEVDRRYRWSHCLHHYGLATRRSIPKKSLCVCGPK
jgi:hypothetical protein